MSRSAFIASRQRVETISSDKTIASAETGELYFIDGSDDVVITLPAVQSGAYFKFMISVAVGSGKTVVIKSNAANVLMDGYLVQESATGEIDALSQSNASDKDKVTFGSSVTAGSWLECYSDGTKWLCTGRATAGTIAFGDQ